jgi:hypothetical protein
MLFSENNPVYDKQFNPTGVPVQPQTARGKDSGIAFTGKICYFLVRLALLSDLSEN